MPDERMASTAIQHFRMYRAAGSGSVTSSIWQGGDQVRGWRYHFNLFQMPPATGRASHLFQPEDLVPLLRVCREVAQVLAEAPAMDPVLQQQLDGVAARLDVLLRTET
jgi:hypothetical protein